MKYASYGAARHCVNNNQRTYSSQLVQTSTLASYMSLVYATGFKIRDPYKSRTMLNTATTTFLFVYTLQSVYGDASVSDCLQKICSLD